MSEETLLKEVRLIVREEVTKIVNNAVVMLIKRMDASDNSILVLIKGVDTQVTNLTTRLDSIALKLEELNNFKSSVDYRLQNVETVVNTKIMGPVTAKYKTVKEVVADYEAKHKKSDDTDAKATKEANELLKSIETTGSL